MEYRADIDGLRAVAVMLVVLNHAGLRFPGGYVGVDVFFVISGFLITGLIAVQRGEGAFSFRKFYLRRAKRLLPALYLVMLAVMAAGYVFLIPSDYSLLSESALSAVALASNVFFWRTSGGYFSPDAASLPLLHIWSLSLEEQFYLLWPAALLLLLRMRSAKARSTIIAGVAVLSFIWGEHASRLHSIGAYFLLPARAGEFMVGALIYLHWRPRSGNVLRGPLLANALSCAGILMILASAVLLDAKSPFPGLNALVPCVGAALIIAAPQFGQSLVNGMLSTRPAVAIGLISYSVYLWHWPLISFLRYARIEITPAIGLRVVALSLVLGAVSWALIERAYRVQLDRKRVAAWTGGVAAIGLVAAPTLVMARDGMPGRFPYALLTQDQLLAERARYWRELPAKAENLRPGEKERQVLIVGNSHAYDLVYALTENGFRGRIKLIETFYQCFNFGHDPVLPEDAHLCAERRAAVLSSQDLKVANAIYLHDNWGGDNIDGLAAMIGDLRAVSKAPIYVFGPKMTFRDEVLAISRQAQGQHHVTVPAINAFAAGFLEASKIDRDRELADYFLRRTSLPDTHYISTLDVQCGKAVMCDVLSPQGEYLFFDAGHFTLVGSKMFGARLKRAHPEVF